MTAPKGASVPSEASAETPDELRARLDALAVGGHPMASRGHMSFAFALVNAWPTIDALLARLESDGAEGAPPSIGVPLVAEERQHVPAGKDFSADHAIVGFDTDDLDQFHTSRSMAVSRLADEGDKLHAKGHFDRTVWMNRTWPTIAAALRQADSDRAELAALLARLTVVEEENDELHEDLVRMMQERNAAIARLTATRAQPS